MGSLKVSCENKKLLEIIDRFVATPILVIGDLILDHYAWGCANRISPEAPVVIVEMTTESKRPGGAGNVAKNLLSLGAKVRLCGVVGDDVDGKEFINIMEELGADISGVLIDTNRPTTTKTRILANGQQIVRVDRELRALLSPRENEAIIAAMKTDLESFKGVVISDYAKGVLSPHFFESMSSIAKQGIFGLDKVPVIIDPKELNFSLYNGATVVKPNRKEAEQASGMKISSRVDAIKAGRFLLQRWSCEVVLITLGDDGMVLVSREGLPNPTIEIPTQAREVYDVSGAGDTVSAVFSLALGSGASLEEAAQLANLAAGIVVGEVGTVAVSPDALKAAVTFCGKSI